MRSLGLILLLGSACSAQDAFGTWKMNPARSTFIGDPHPRAVTVRIGRHANGETFTFDRIRGNGQATTFSIILYMDGKDRDFQDADCAGAQSSRRLDEWTVELVLKCGSGQSARFVRRIVPDHPHDLILDVTDILPDGRRLERHLVLEKQAREK